jgi:pimeloyl-ACP methyl ester carboxylesterase
MSNVTAEVEFKEGSVLVGARSVRYEEAGSGDETLVVLHGAAGLAHAAAWNLLAAAGHRVILLEQPGFGTSEPDDSRNTKEYAETVRTAIDDIVGGPYHLIGKSFGSEVAAWVSVSAASIVKSLTLLSPLLVRPGTSITSPDAPPLVSRLLDGDNSDLRAAIAELAVPALVILGTEDETVPHTLLREYAPLIPGIHLSLVYQAGHFAEVERPESLANLLDSFVRYGSGFKETRATSMVFP